MTACNLWLQPTAGHLVTDAAMYDTAGRVLHIASKVVVAEEALMAIAFLGTMDQERIANALNASGATSQRDAVACLAPMARYLREENASREPMLEAAGLAGFAILAVTWDHMAGHPRGWVVQTHDCPHPLAEPYKLTETHGYTTPDVPLPVDMACGRLSGIEHGKGVLMAQRRALFEGQSIVGGFGEVTTVTADGVQKRRLIDWPDKLGERIAQ